MNERTNDMTRLTVVAELLLLGIRAPVSPPGMGFFQATLQAGNFIFYLGILMGRLVGFGIHHGRCIVRARVTRLLFCWLASMSDSVVIDERDSKAGGAKLPNRLSGSLRLVVVFSTP